jgi:1-phosphatidylinositol phosphodiesterase
VSAAAAITPRATRDTLPAATALEVLMRSFIKLGVAVTGVALAMLGSCTMVQSGPAGPAYVSSGTARLEVNIDRPGSDYRTFDLSSGQPEECRDTCMVEPQCLAFTFAKAGTQGPRARCALKSAVPQPSRSAGCVSGVKSAPPAGVEYTAPPLEEAPPDVSPPLPAPPPGAASAPSACCVSGVSTEGRAAAEAAPGAVPPFELDVDRPGYDFQHLDLPQPRAELCRAACLREGRCQAFTYMNPGVQGPSARCWLKTSVPPPTPSNCCISGVK